MDLLVLDLACGLYDLRGVVKSVVSFLGDPHKKL